MYVKGLIDAPDTLTQNFFQRGIEWERESSLEVFQNAQLLLSQPVGIRIQGNAYRKAVYKRFSVYARKEYSSSEYFDVNLINDYSQHSLLLRQGQRGDLHVICQMIGRDRDVATTDFIPVDVFLDGEFWYTTYLFEKFNEKNFAQKYNLSEDNVVIYKAWGDTDENSLQAGENPLSSLTAFIYESDLSNDEEYLKYCEILDIQSYIDWYCFNAYLLNMDYSEYSNTVFWHTIIREDDQKGDSRWRLGLYDMDLGWVGDEEDFPGSFAFEINPFTDAQWPIYSALKKNKLFRKQFVLTFMDLVNANLSVENTAAIMEELGIDNENYRNFFENRAEYVVPYMAEEFGLTGAQETVTLSSNASGTPVTLNTISPELRLSMDTDVFSWTGSYFTDYPVTVTAKAPGFSHWEVTANGRTQRYTGTTIEVPVSTGGVQIHAVFQ